MYGYLVIFFKFFSSIYYVMETMEEYEDEANGRVTKRSSPQAPSANQTPNGDKAAAASKQEELRNQFIAACNKGDLRQVQRLLDKGYRDEDNLALSIAISSLNSKLISKLLQFKSHPDPEFKINKKNVQFNSAHSNLISNLTFSSIFPTTPVMCNYHSIGSLKTIDRDWLLSAALHHNPKLKLSNAESALASITRLDLSGNNLVKLPICVFQLTSLKVLNLSQNCLQTLPETNTEVYSSNHLYSSANKSRMSKSKSFTVNLSAKKDSPAGEWNLPSLEELHLVDNELESLPMSIFELPNLQLLDCSNNHLRHLPANVWFAAKLRELNLSLNLIKDLPSKLPSAGGSGGGGGGQSEMANSSSTLAEMSGKFSKSIPDLVFQEDQLNFDADANLKPQQIRHLNNWSAKVELVNSVYIEDETEKAYQSKLVLLNLSHNSFTAIPDILSCACPALSRLNLSYNCLREMGSVKLYPANIKHIDLSNNQIGQWYTSEVNPNDDSMFNCFLFSELANTNKLLGTFCQHKEHVKLENLRTLLISNNQLDELVLSSVDGMERSAVDADQFELTELKLRNKLVFPNLSYLDISLNRLRSIPREISHLTNLSVLNISKNRDVCQLPAEMGLLSKLWNLNTAECNLDEPIRSMIESKKYKTMDIVGYLKSILEDSKPYARIKLMLVGVQGIGKTTLLDLLRQEGSTNFRHHRRPEHWGRRMGNKSIGLKTPKGVTLSTVGVDVSDFIYERKTKGRPSFGPVTFRSWDFGGQQEYYATHQYFLSKRSLYLVVWKIVDGEKGVESIHKWLVNIQARAPNSPVIIIGTFHDQIKEYLPKNFSEDLQKMIRERFINIIDPDKVGLPRVVESIEASTKTKYNIKNLCNLIYDTVFDIRCPGSKERLLQQKIPASYLALEDIVNYLAAQRKSVGKDPVLKAEEYKNLVLDEMHSKYGKTFRDLTELNQATSFLHDNGVLLHYEDSTLKDLYFLDPQWLCDLLAHVVTIREINPYAKNGTMKTDDLKELFKSTSCSFSIKSYILSLLNKFEVALTWDNRTILIPSLLPSEESIMSSRSIEVRIPVRSRNRGAMNSFFNKNRKLIGYQRRMNSEPCDFEDLSTEVFPFRITSLHRPANSIYRIFLMTYFPCGFWSRLIVKLLADDIYSDVLKSFFNLPEQLTQDPEFVRLLNTKCPEWKCWQTGLSLVHWDQEIFRVKEILGSVFAKPGEFDYLQDVKFNLQQESANWADIEIQKASILEIYLPNQSLLIESTRDDQKYLLDANLISITKLLSLTVDHIDILLEDWYPSLGTRFVHTSDGRFLVTRIVPCIQCMNCNYNQDTISNKSIDSSANSRSQDSSGGGVAKKVITKAPASKNKSFDSGICERSVVFDSRKQQINDLNDLKEIKDLNSLRSLDISSRSQRGETAAAVTSSVFQNADSFKLDDSFKVLKCRPSMSVYCFMIEECILKASENRPIVCPVHKKLALSQIAPDTIFCDLASSFVFNSDSIKRAKLLGRGAFGFVFRATIETGGKCKTSSEVAMKTLQPVEPGSGAKNSDNAIYKAALSKWERDPLQYSSKAYCTARQELNILLQLNHTNIVPLMGVCLKPLALILQLARLGALDLILKDYRRAGMQLDFSVLQMTILQIARALEYLHQNKIIYRDLKSENVLCWEYPLAYSTKDELANFRVDVKLADYGISRTTLPTGTKGFGGTEGFIAPEIHQYNGEEEYTEKVDCFSFGMFIFELISLRLPFEGQESVKDHILEGLRPKLTQRDILYPSYVLDLMIQCWSQAPSERPGTSHIVSIVSAPEFIHMLDAVSLVDNYAILCSDIFCRNDFFEIWIGRLGRQTDLLFCDSIRWHNYKTISNLDHLTVMSICVVPDSGIWVGDSKATVHVFSIDGSYIEITNFCLDFNTLTAVKSLKYIACLDVVIVSSTSGRIWLCEKESLVLNEIENQSLPFLCHSLTECADRDGFRCQLWCGQSEGCITIVTLESFQVYKKEFVNHYQCERSVPILERFDVFEIISESNFVYTYLYPGTVVYQWDIFRKTIVQKLDCSKLAPCSESLMSISIEQHLNPSKCQIKSIAIMDNQLYIGTTLGSLIIVEGSTMIPITVFRPFEEEIRLILAVDPKKLVHFSNNLNVFESSESYNKICNKNKKFIITIGKGFRGLLDRYLNPLHDATTGLVTHSGLYAVIWNVSNWNS